MTSLEDRRAEKLTSQGFELLDAEAFGDALVVAAELESLRHTASFEIAALAHCGLGDLEAAISVLERGVALAPSVWVNWQLLGNCRSDLERYDDAWSAYVRALDCPNVWRSSVILNQATLRAREHRPQEALSLLNEIDDKELHRPVTFLRVRTLLDLAQYHDAVTLARRHLDALDIDAPYVERGERWALLARSLLFSGAEPEEVRAAANSALVDARGNAEALWVLRQLHAERSAGSKYFRLLIHATQLPDAGEQRYYASIDVVADDLEEALRFVRSTEPDIALLQIGDSEVIEDRPNETKGVYAQSARHFYPPGS